MTKNYNPQNSRNLYGDQIAIDEANRSKSIKDAIEERSRCKISLSPHYNINRESMFL
jgi:hypothetical protein